MMNRLLDLCGRVLVFLLTSLLLYAAVEWAFPRVFTRLFTLEAMQKFDEPYGIWPLLQTSKEGFYPHDYIALTGDSYAMGMGDQLMHDPDRYRPRFSSAHTIADLTGKDVISYGMPGSGSIRGIISNPVAGQRYIRKLVDPKFPPPRWMLVYFYEGNDLTENWMYYDKTFAVDYAGQDYNNAQVFDRYVQEVALSRHRLYQAANAAGWKERLLFWRYISRLYAEKIEKKKIYRKKYPNEFGLVYVPEKRWQPQLTGASVNKALIAGDIAQLPDNLQGPSMDLSPEQLLQAVGTFDKSLAYSRRYFTETRFAVVYIPSVLSIYALSGDKVSAQNYFSDDTLFDRQVLEQRHRWIREQIAGVCAAQGLPFVDATDDLRAAATKEALHGPRDWNHLSREGYETLGRSVVRQMMPLWADE